MMGIIKQLRVKFIKHKIRSHVKHFNHHDNYLEDKESKNNNFFILYKNSNLTFVIPAKKLYS